MARGDDTLSTVLFNRAYSRYEVGDYSGSLEDLKRVTSRRLRAIKHSNIGLCFYNLGLHQEAEKEYFSSIKENPKVVEAYYNLAVLYSFEKKTEKAIKLLNSCLKINRNFLSAHQALKALRMTGQIDWYDWWFKASKAKKALGITLISFLLSLATLFGYLSYAGNGDVGLAAPMALILVVLILPNLRKLKILGIEFQSAFIGAVNAELQPIFANKTPPSYAVQEIKP